MPSDDAAPSLHDRAREGWLMHTLRECAIHDFAVFGYLLALNIVVIGTPPSPEHDACVARTLGLMATLLITIVLVRGRILKHTWITALIYRIGIYGPVQVSYFFLKQILPLVNTRTLDQKLYAFDLNVFHVEPAMAWDKFVNPATSEWFSFFYFGYFLLMALHVVPLLFFDRRKQLVGEFTFGMLVLFSMGHTLYMVVPGYGPYRAMADSFHNTFAPGTWHNLVMNAVHSGGALMDIFPSLHTGAPTLIAFFSFRNRDKLAFKYTWPVVTFCTANIIVATMFLRWHYLVDVVAGFSLAITIVLISRPVTRWELARRKREHLGALWPEFSHGQQRSDLSLAGEPLSR